MLRVIVMWLRSLVRSAKFRAELEDELEFHVEMETEANVQRGMPADRARTEALRAFGGLERFKEASHEAWGGERIHGIVRDLRNAARALRRSPTFALSVVAPLSLCIGANTAAFSGLYALVLAPLPFSGAEELVQVQHFDGDELSAQQPNWSRYRYLEDASVAFHAFGVAAWTQKTVTWETPARRVRGKRVSHNYFDVLGVEPVLGRFFTAAEVLSGTSVVVLPGRVWESRFGGDPSVLGNEISFAGEARRVVVGVAPASLVAIDGGVEFFVPFDPQAHEQLSSRHAAEGSELWARLRPGVTLAEAKTELNRLDAEWFASEADQWTRDTRLGGAFRIDLHVGRSTSLKAPLLLIQFGAAIALLLACVNIVALSIGRMHQKSREFSLRRSLGASVRGLLRLVVLETALLTALAVGVGAILGWMGIGAFNRALPLLDPTASAVHFHVALPFVSGLIAGLAIASLGTIPIITLPESRLVSHLAGSSAEETTGGLWPLVAKGLPAVQVAVAFSLLVATGLVSKSYALVRETDPGFDAESVVKGQIVLADVYNHADTRAVRDRILEGMRRIPGAEAALLYYDAFVPANPENTRTVLVRGMPTQDGQPLRFVHRQKVSPEFFHIMGIELLEGRLFEASDQHEETYVVDRLFADRFLGPGLRVGAEMVMGNSPPPPDVPWNRVIGVVDRANLYGLEARDGLPVVYTVLLETQGSWQFTVLLRSRRSAEEVITDMRTELVGIDPSIPLLGVDVLRDSLDDMIFERRAVSLVMTAFSLVALVLAFISTYGVLTYQVSRRKREVGVRRALGASGMDVAFAVLRDSVTQVAAGIALGAGAGIVWSGSLQRLLFEITPYDPATYLYSATGLAVVATIAALLPAARAARVNPITAIRG